MSEWHYTSDGQQLGPVTGAQLKQLAASGQLQPTDMIWKEGMAEWVPATKVKGLFASGAPASPVAVPVAAPAAVTCEPRALATAHAPSPAPQQPVPAAAIGYYNPTDMGARTARIMRGYARPTGPQTEWPLSDAHLAELKTAERHRKSIRNCANLINLFFLLSLIFVALGGLGLALAANSGGGIRMLRFLGERIAIQLGIMVGLMVLYFFAARATTRCQIWAPITVLVLLGIGTALTAISMLAAMSQNAPSEAMVVLLIILGISAAFMYVVIRGMIAIPKFRACPVWTQEALINAKL